MEHGWNTDWNTDGTRIERGTEMERRCNTDRTRTGKNLYSGTYEGPMRIDLTSFRQSFDQARALLQELVQQMVVCTKLITELLSLWVPVSKASNISAIAKVVLFD